MSKPNNPPAFPLTKEAALNPVTNLQGVDLTSGMSLRDWFASQAPEPPETWWGGAPKNCAGYALWGFQYADAMLAEREK